MVRVSSLYSGDSFYKTLRPVRGPTQPLIQSVSALFPGGKAAGMWSLLNIGQMFGKTVTIPIIALKCIYSVDRANSVLYPQVVLSWVCRTVGCNWVYGKFYDRPSGWRFSSLLCLQRNPEMAPKFEVSRAASLAVPDISVYQSRPYCLEGNQSSFPNYALEKL
jgi:hypothetical protein